MKTRRYTFAIAWTICVLLASSDAFSSQHTGGGLQWLVDSLTGHRLNELALEIVQFIIRKLAHLTEYGILGFLWFRAVRGEEGGWRLRWSAIAVFIALAVATTDEIHQSFVPSRTASPLDVVIDVCGALLAQLRRRP